MIAFALRELGTTEHPFGSNRVKYWEIYPSLNGFAWCGTFVWWVLSKNGVAPSWSTARRFVDTAVGLSDAKAHGAFYTGKPNIGDVVWFNFDGDSQPEHVGLVVDNSEWSKGFVGTIEGNTSLRDNTNGGEVMKRRRPIGCIIGYGRVAYTATNVPPTRAVPKPAPATRPVVVKAGQTLGGIAAVLGLSVSAIMAVNPQIHDPDVIREGQTIQVPVKPSTAPQRPVTASPSPSPRTTVSKPSRPTTRLPVAVPQPKYPGKLLRMGSGRLPSDRVSVTLVQRKLKALGLYRGAIDGRFGPQTYSAVVKFQERHRTILTVDGVVGPATWRVLFK